MGDHSFAAFGVGQTCLQNRTEYLRHIECRIMHVRDATVEDAEAVRKLHAESIGKLGPESYDEEQVEAWAKGCESAEYASAIEGEGGDFVVAEDDGTVVAFGSVKFDSPEGYVATVDAEITGVYVQPSVARTGVGSAVLAELEQRTRERGVRALGLTASLNSIPFYESHGYERVREHGHEFSSSESTGVTGTVVEMKTEL